ncbi:hypothetical protein J21TS7_28010 [Paenibacillus cineris]|uniref:Uncharacterized protein n=1 Tax=Paenibacillus cineris TaxID=237530 RepID=A0ABQ4LDD9_9BACL|nr:hypothetical protein J21TS7_28010 [Paenibacillus cineris]
MELADMTYDLQVGRKSEKERVKKQVNDHEFDIDPSHCRIFSECA